MSDTNNNPHEIPSDSTPTWQMELLVSGAVVIAIWQLLVALDQQMGSALSPLRNVSIMTPIFYIYPYAALLSAGVAFAMHLLLRSIWIAVVGIVSVFPKGIQWENYKGTERTKEQMRQRFASPMAIAENLDNASTVVYALGIVGATTYIALLLVILVAASIVKLLHWKWLAHLSEHQVFSLVFLPFAAVGVGAQLVDVVFAKWIPANSSLAKAARSVLLGMNRVAFPASTGYLATLITTSFGRWAGLIGLQALLISALVFTGIRMAAQRGAFEPSSDAIKFATASSMYADQRIPSQQYGTPYIDSIQSQDPYLRLSIPYRHHYFSIIADRVCKTNSAVTLDAKKLACVKRAIAVALDDKPLLCDFALFNNQATDIYELSCMIEVRNLPTGRHVVTIEFLPLIVQGKPEIHHIPFWR